MLFQISRFKFTCALKTLACFAMANAVVAVAFADDPAIDPATPANATNCPGTTASFTVSATSAGNLTYQWSTNGAPLADGGKYSGSQSATLFITNVTAADALTYTVAVTTDFGGGNTTNVSAALTVLTTTDAGAGMADQTNCVGANITFTSTATGANLTYIWRFNGNELVGETNSSFTTNSVSAGSAGTYAVEVTGACGSATNSASLTVNTPTTATALANLTNCPGTSATFSTTAGGTEPFSYVWRFNGNELVGETNNSFTTNNISAASAGTYTVEVTGACGSATNNATLTVNETTTATPLTGLTNCPGTSATFSTTAGGTGPFSYVWRFNGSELVGETNSSFTTNSISAASAGSYTVEVAGACGSVTNSATLTVNTPATATPLTSLTNCPGTSATFSTTAGGTGPFSYVWRFNGNELLGETNNTFTTNSVNAASAGTYLVEVTGACGSVTNSATLTVNETTLQGAGMPSQTVCDGASVTFTSTATGTALTYQWVKDGENLVGETNRSFTTNGVTVPSSGEYWVEVTGACGSIINSADLHVEPTTDAGAGMANQTRCPGASATFTSTVTGTSLIYTWRFNGNLLTGATSSSFTTNNVSAGSAGNYVVEVTGFCGSATNSAELTVLTNVSATALTSLTNCPGTSATFTTTASGTGPFSFVWRFNGSELLGETTSGFTTNSVSAGSAGTYTVEVTGVCGSVTNNATLTVNELTLPGAGMPSQTVCEDTSVTFTSTATGTGLTYVWVKDGVVIEGETNRSFTTNGVTVPSSGEYWVEVTGACGSLINSADLHVQAKTVAGAGMANQTQCPGAIVTFTSTVTGENLTYAWRKDGGLLPGVTTSSFTTNNIGNGSAGLYTVEVTGVCGGATNSAVLTVLTNVSATPLTSISNCPGTSATFSTTAGGTGPLSFIWRFNGAELVGETSTSFTTNSVSAASAGTYTIEVSGTCGRVTNNATLTINELTLPGAGMASRIVCEGVSVTFTSTATGTDLTYQWVKDGFVLTGETNSSFTTNGVVPASGGEYWVEVSGACGSIINSADLNVNARTDAGAGMADQTNCVGANITFTSTVTGENLTYVWRKDGVLLTGVTGSSFTTNNLGTSASGNYCVEVTGVCGSATNCATLTINTLTTATALLNLTNCSGTGATFSTAAGGTGPFSYIWSFNGSVLVGETNSSFTTNNVSAASAGTYSVDAIGACGTVTRTASLTVNALTTATPLTSLTNCAGSSATFSTTAGGTGPFSYVWRFNGNTLSGVTGSSFTTNNVSGGSVGNYSVEVTGVCGSITNSATLTVRTTTATALTSLNNCPGTSATFTTTVGGVGPFTFVWKRNGTLLPAETNSSFTTNNVTAASAGTYAVEVTAACGNVTNSATLTVLTFVSATPLTSLTNCPGSSANFSTTAGGGGPFNYIWRFNGNTLVGQTNNIFTTNNVSAGSAGTYTVEVGSPCGSVTNSTTLTILNDLAPPVIFCSGDKIVECATAWSFDQPTALDAYCGTNVAIVIVSTVTNGGDCSQTITRAWLATDCCGNTATCDQTLTVLDTTPPVLGPTSTNIFTAGTTNDNFVGAEDSSPSPGLVTWLTNHGISVYKGFDDCTVNRTFAHTFSDLPACIGQARLRARLKPCGETPDNDTVDIVFTDTTGNRDSGLSRYITTTGNPEPGLFVGNWGNYSSVMLNLDLAALPLANGGTTNMIPYLNHLRVLDFIVRDDTAVDYLILELTVSCCGADQTLECGSPFTFSEPSALDDCVGTNVTATVVTTLTNSSIPCEIIVTRTWEISDSCSNKTSCSKRITLVDTTPPLVLCAVTKTVDCSSAWDFDVPLTLDGCCGTNLILSVLNTVTNSTVCPATVSRTWLATDCCNNSATCSQTVMLNDTMPPVITCPSNIVVEGCVVPVCFSITAAGSCSSVTVTSTPPSCSEFAVGTTLVHCVATDACSNSSSCDFTVTVVPPVLKMDAVGTNTVISWSGSGTLQEADRLTDVWTNLPATSPYEIPQPMSGIKFYRLLCY